MAIFERVVKFDFSNVEFSRENFINDCAKGFVAKVCLKEFPNNNQRKLLFACPYFSIFGVRLHAEKDIESFTLFEKRAKVWTYADENGYVYLLELKAAFQSSYQENPRETTVDLLLNLFDATQKEVYAYYDGVKIGWIYEGEEKNYDYTFGTLAENKENLPIIDGTLEIALANDWRKTRKEVVMDKVEKSINFYSPRGYNTWAGDVMNFYHDGVYHLLYLHDRHHHDSRWGGGAHSVRHLTTTDFKDWTEQPPIVDIEEEWNSAGTGTMFYHNGKYYFSHGFHTTRMVPYEKTGSRLIDEQPQSKERIMPVVYAKLQEEKLYPSGANYLVSEDGVNFTRGEHIFHISENPSVYLDEDNRLFMFGGYGSSGIWRADSIDSEWVLDKTAEVPQSPLDPSTECPSMFSLNGYKYLIMGFTGYWQSDKNGEVYQDVAMDGFDVYDGLDVPMVAKTKDNRLILSGWVGSIEWASVIVHRELIQGENGRLFMKWLPELAPNTNELTVLAKDVQSLALDERKSYYFEMDVDANKNTQMYVRFGGEKEAVLAIDSKNKIIQINDSEELILPLYELVKQGKGNKRSEKVHKKGVDFALGQADTIQKPYKLKIQLYYEQKSDSVYIDAEIGGQRTIVSNRAKQKYSSVSFEIKDGKIENNTIYHL